MHPDLNMALMRATFKLEQPQAKGGAIVGTGWLVRLPGPTYGSMQDKVVLVTATHVLNAMVHEEMTIHWRREDDGGTWHREPKNVTIRGPASKSLFYSHPARDVSVVAITPPDQPRAHAIDFSLLGDDTMFRQLDVRPGDEVLAWGYPRGITANALGFPILRSGRVASFPLWPSSDFPTFLMDFAVFAGNSGGPVYMSDRSRKAAGAQEFHEAQFVAGMLVQQVTLTDERLEIGIVLHAAFIREAIEGYVKSGLSA